MTASRLNILWKVDAWVQETGNSAFVRQIASPQPGLRCPSCASIVYSRRHRLCGVCGEALPEHLLFNASEASRLKELVRTEQQKHRHWMNQRATDRAR